MLTSNALTQAEQMIGQTVTSSSGTTGIVESVNLGTNGGTKPHSLTAQC